MCGEHDAFLARMADAAHQQAYHQSPQTDQFFRRSPPVGDLSRDPVNTTFRDPNNAMRQMSPFLALSIEGRQNCTRRAPKTAPSDGRFGVTRERLKSFQMARAPAPP
jgi:hypothetical protein